MSQALSRPKMNAFYRGLRHPKCPGHLANALTIDISQADHYLIALRKRCDAGPNPVAPLGFLKSRQGRSCGVARVQIGELVQRHNPAIAPGRTGEFRSVRYTRANFRISRPRVVDPGARKPAAGPPGSRPLHGLNSSDFYLPVFAPRVKSEPIIPQMSLPTSFASPSQLHSIRDAEQIQQPGNSKQERNKAAPRRTTAGDIGIC